MKRTSIGIKNVNRRNDRWLCADPSDISNVMHTKFPLIVIILGVVTVSQKSHHNTGLLSTGSLSDCCTDVINRLQNHCVDLPLQLIKQWFVSFQKFTL